MLSVRLPEDLEKKIGQLAEVDSNLFKRLITLLLVVNII